VLLRRILYIAESVRRSVAQNTTSINQLISTLGVTNVTENYEIPKMLPVSNDADITMLEDWLDSCESNYANLVSCSNAIRIFLFTTVMEIV
jgi:hypothetical protein